jgi:hypothetical protein
METHCDACLSKAARYDLRPQACASCVQALVSPGARKQGTALSPKSPSGPKPPGPPKSQPPRMSWVRDHHTNKMAKLFLLGSQPLAEQGAAAGGGGSGLPLPPLPMAVAAVAQAAGGGAAGVPDAGAAGDEAAPQTAQQAVCALRACSECALAGSFTAVRAWRRHFVGTTARAQEVGGTILQLMLQDAVKSGSHPWCGHACGAAGGHGG